MRKTLGITLIAGTLMFGGAGVANATAPSAPVPSSTTTTQADDTEQSRQPQGQRQDRSVGTGRPARAGRTGWAEATRRNSQVALTGVQHQTAPVGRAANVTVSVAPIRRSTTTALNLRPHPYDRRIARGERGMRVTATCGSLASRLN